MSKYFYRIHHKEVTWANDKEITEQQEKNNEVMKSGAIYLYTILKDNIIRNSWIDHKGFPLKANFYDKGLLVCSFSAPTLQKNCGVGRKMIEKWVNVLKEAGWIVINRSVRDGQQVFIMGTHGSIDGKYTEVLYKYNTGSNEDTKTDEQTDKEMRDFLNSEWDLL